MPLPSVPQLTSSISGLYTVFRTSKDTQKGGLPVLMLARVRAARCASSLLADMHPWACCAAAAQCVQARGEATASRRWYDSVTVAEDGVCTVYCKHKTCWLCPGVVGTV